MISPMRCVSLACLLLVPLATGCGGSPSMVTNPRSILPLAITPGTHPDLVDFQAGIESVELLDRKGRSTGNLLPQGVRAPVASEDSEPVLLALRAPPEGRYTELRIRYAGGDQAARVRSGERQAVVVEGREQRIPIGRDGMEHRRGLSWLALRHRSDVDAAQDAPRRWRWWPRSDAQAGAGTFFHDSRVRVQSIVSATEFRFAAVFDVLGGKLEVEFAVRPDAIVIAESVGRISREELFERLVPGQSVVKILGRVGADGVVQVRHLVLRHRPSGGNPEPDGVEVLGEIVALDQPALVASINVLSVRQGADQWDRHFGNSVDRPIAISLDGAVIRREGGCDRLSVGDLAVGQRVEVEFRDFPTPEPMRVSSITIEDDMAQFEARVADVTNLPQSFIAVPRLDDSLFRRGALNSSVRVQLSPGTQITKGDEIVGAEEIVVGALVRVRGTLVDPGVMNAASVRVREECSRGR